jgi:hypothetical protein
MAGSPHQQDDGARGRELEMMREIAQIVSWCPSDAERAAKEPPAERPADGDPERTAAPPASGLSRRRPSGG